MAAATAPGGGGGGGGCNASPTARQARYNMLGYLFGDGHWGSGGYNYTARSACKEARMKANIKASGINVAVSGNKFRFPKVAPFDRPQDFGPSPETAAGVATADDLRWFLAGIIEGEGSGSGKVMDDPNWGRTAGVVELYRRLGVVVKPHKAPPACNCPTGTGFWNTYVDPSAPTATYNGYIAIIRSFPFADTTRVPKPR